MTETQIIKQARSLVRMREGRYGFAGLQESKTMSIHAENYFDAVEHFLANSKCTSLLYCTGTNIQEALWDVRTCPPQGWSNMITTPILMMEINRHLERRGHIFWEAATVSEMRLHARIN